MAIAYLEFCHIKHLRSLLHLESLTFNQAMSNQACHFFSLLLFFSFLRSNLSSPSYGPKPNFTYYEHSLYKDSKSWLGYFTHSFITSDPNGTVAGKRLEREFKIRNLIFIKIETICVMLSLIQSLNYFLCLI